jgi:hypothetical protein
MAPPGGTSGLGSEAAPQRVVNHLLEGLPQAVNLVLDQPGDVGVQRQRRPHEGIMMLHPVFVKMPS